MPHKIIFMGTPQFSVSTLEALINSSYEIVCVYTQPPKQSNRGLKVNLSPIHQCAEKNRLTIRHPARLNNKEELNFFKSLNSKIVVVVAYGKIIPKDFLEIPQFGFLNIHASLLPRWRGAAPIQRAIMNLDKETGISIMKIAEKLDTGPVMKKITIKITEQDNTDIISRKLSKISNENIITILDNIFNNNIEFIEQDHKNATYAEKINKDQSKIDWDQNAKNILAKINSLNPRPGAWFSYKNSRFKVWKAMISKQSGKPGLIMDKDFTIGCKDKSLKILEVQKEGKTKLLMRDFLRGMSFNIGDLLN
jgi:methionyl-tRNA formyltransferase